MWLLTSLSRPDRIRDLVASYAWGSGESRVMLVLWAGDKRMKEYLAQTWPANWTTEIVDVRGNGPTYNEMLSRYPDEPQYGFLADDAVLDIQGMLSELEREAGRWNVAYANDKFHGESIPTMPCLGGDLVRAVGYLSPPSIIHQAIDCAWHEIGAPLGALRYRADLTYTHKHPLFGTAKFDATYRDSQYASINYQQIFRAWVIGGGLDGAVERARAAMPVVG